MEKIFLTPVTDKFPTVLFTKGQGILEVLSKDGDFLECVFAFLFLNEI